MSGVPYADIEAVEEVLNPGQVTEKIRNGEWRLLKIAETWTEKAHANGQVERTACPTYILGRVRGGPQRSLDPREPPAGSYVKKCSKCGQDLRMVKLEGGAWAPRAVDGYGEHKCEQAVK